MLIISHPGFLSETTTGSEGALVVRVHPGHPKQSTEDISRTHPEAPFMMSPKFILALRNLAGNRAYFKLKVQCLIFVEGRKDG